MTDSVDRPRRRSRRGALALTGSASFLGGLFVYAWLLYLLAIGAVTAWSSVLEAKQSPLVPSIDRVVDQLPALDATFVAASVVVALVMIWAGYCLRVLALIARTQLVDFE